MLLALYTPGARLCDPRNATSLGRSDFTTLCAPGAPDLQTCNTYSVVLGATQRGATVLFCLRARRMEDVKTQAQKERRQLRRVLHDGRRRADAQVLGPPLANGP